MSDRFQNLKKIANEPAARLLASANAKLGTSVKAPVTAPVSQVLEELDKAGATIDILRLLSVALPARERVWWACLAARDIVGQGTKKPPPPLTAAEEWVYRPSDENREQVRATLETADDDDETVHCARAALLANGTLGPGELDEHPAPPGGSESSAFAMNVISLGAHAEAMEEHMTLLIDRGLDIARGGNGRLDGNAPTGVPAE